MNTASPTRLTSNNNPAPSSSWFFVRRANGLTDHKIKLGATITLLVTSPSHHVSQTVVKRDQFSPPVRHRLSTPIVALISVLKSAAKMRYAKMDLVRSNAFGPFAYRR